MNASQVGYTFQNDSLLEKALTHRSFANEHAMSSGNESLALLGDAVLQFFVTSRLYQMETSGTPGLLTEKRKSFVCEEALAEKARRLGLGEVILFGKGEKQQGGPSKTSHLSETFEALIGAIFLDGGTEKVFQFLSEQFHELHKGDSR